MTSTEERLLLQIRALREENRRISDIIDSELLNVEGLTLQGKVRALLNVLDSHRMIQKETRLQLEEIASNPDEALFLVRKLIEDT